MAQNNNANSKPARPYNGNYTGPYIAPRESKIRGRIVYEDNGKPVRRGGVTLLRAESITIMYGNMTITNDNGEFEISGVPAGSYYPVIDVPGVLNPMSYRGFYAKNEGDEQKIAHAKLGRFFQKIETDGVTETSVVILASRAASIAGRVTYADGEPAAGIRIQALRKAGDTFEAQTEESTDPSRNLGLTKTDDRGFFRFAGLPPGDYIVFISEKAIHTASSDYQGGLWGRDRASELKTYYPGVASVKNAKVLEVAKGQQMEAIDITIPDRKLYKLKGVVLSKADKKPVKGATIRIERKEDRELLSYSSIPYDRSFEVDDEGMWMVKDLPAGDYRINIQPPYIYVPESDVKEKKTPKLGGVSQEIEILGEGPESLIIELPQESSISGTVSVEGGKPVPKVISVYTLQKDNAVSYASGSVFGDGNAKRADFRVEGVVTGENILSVYIDNNAPYYIKSIKSGSAESGPSATVTVKEGEEVKGIEIVLSDKVGTLQGKVNAGEDVYEFPMVVIVPVVKNENEARGKVRSAIPNDIGAFDMKAAPGEYYVCFFTYSPWDEPWDDWYKRQTEGAVKVTIKEGETTKITLKLPEK